MSSPVTGSSRQYIPISLDESLSLKGCKHAAHCLLYSSANCSGVVYVLVQMRFDGLIGFAGGEVDVDDVTVDEIIAATNRELEEEINYHLNGVTQEEWICSHRDHSSTWIQHFFAKELTGDELTQLESTHMNAQHFPSESLGMRHSMNG
jgi:8-oxo-dGTP pyrophosphatase MutT (NUDIX family)